MDRPGGAMACVSLVPASAVVLRAGLCLRGPASVGAMVRVRLVPPKIGVLCQPVWRLLWEGRRPGAG